MSNLDVPDYFTSISGLGRLVDYFPLRRQKINRIISLFLVFVSLLGAVVVLIAGVLNTYERYYRNGPAVVLKTISLPAAGAVILLVLGVAGIVGALRTWNKGAAIFSGGLATSDLRGVHALRWEDIASIKVDIINRQLSDKIASLQHTYTLIDNNGKVLVLDESIARVEQLGSQIREKVNPLLFTRYSTAFQQGQPVHFGPVSISLQEGLRTGKHVLSWDAFQDAEVQQGILYFKVDKGVEKQRDLSLQAAEIPNLEVLLSLLDMRKRAAGGG